MKKILLVLCLFYAGFLNAQYFLPSPFAKIKQVWNTHSVPIGINQDSTWIAIARYAASSSISGTTNYVPKFTSSTVIGNSNIFDNGTSISIGNASPTASTKFEVNSTTGAILFPRMTTTQQNALTGIDGMVLYNNTLPSFMGRAASTWYNFVGTSTTNTANYYPKFVTSSTVTNSLLFDSTASHTVGKVLRLDGLILKNSSYGNAKVLTSNANGVASWATPPLSGVSGTTNFIPLFTGSTTIGNSSLSQSSGDVLIATGKKFKNSTGANFINMYDTNSGIELNSSSNGVTIDDLLVSEVAVFGVSNSSGANITLNCTSNANSINLSTPAIGSTYSLVLPVNQGAASTFLKNDGSGNLSWGASSVYNVKDYGAIGNGIADDRAAIVAALAAIPTQGGTLYFPAGDYLVTSQITLNKNVNIVGEGQSPFNYYNDITGVSGHPGATNILCNSATANLFLITNTGSNAFPVISVMNLSVFNTQTTPSAGSAFKIANGVQNTLFENVNITGFYVNLNITKGSFVSIDKCRFIDPVAYGVIVGDSSHADVGIWHISNTVFLSSRTTGRYPTAGLYYKGGADGLKVVNCHFDAGLNYTLPTVDSTMNFRYCIYSDFVYGNSGDVLIDNCLLENYRSSAIKIVNSGSCYNINISNVILQPIANPTTNVRPAIDITGINTVAISNYTAQNYLGSIAQPVIRLTSCVSPSIGEGTYGDFNDSYTLTSCTNPRFTKHEISAALPNLLMGSTAIQSSSSGNSIFSENSYFNGSANKYLNTNYADAIQMNSGDISFYTAPSGTAGNSITYSNKMTIKNGGSVGIGTSSPAASALLDLTSTTQGVLVPRMNTTQMNAISSPATALLIYNTDSSNFCFYASAAWHKFGSGGGGAGTVTSIATSSGITGGTITTTGTLKADTALLATHYYVNNTDSIGTVTKGTISCSGGAKINPPSTITNSVSAGAMTIDGHSTFMETDSVSSNATSWTASYSNILVGEQVYIDYFKTTSSDCVITFPSGTTISAISNAYFVNGGQVATISSASGVEFGFWIMRLSTTRYMVSIAKHAY